MLALLSLLLFLSLHLTTSFDLLHSRRGTLKRRSPLAPAPSPTFANKHSPAFAAKTKLYAATPENDSMDFLKSKGVIKDLSTWASAKTIGVDEGSGGVSRTSLKEEAVTKGEAGVWNEELQGFVYEEACGDDAECVAELSKKSEE